MERTNDSIGIIRTKKKIEAEQVGETITLTPEVIELIQELEKSPHSLRIQTGLSQEILKAWQEKSS